MKSPKSQKTEFDGKRRTWKTVKKIMIFVNYNLNDIKWSKSLRSHFDIKTHRTLTGKTKNCEKSKIEKQNKTIFFFHRNDIKIWSVTIKIILTSQKMAKKILISTLFSLIVDIWQILEKCENWYITFLGHPNLFTLLSIWTKTLKIKPF